MGREMEFSGSDNQVRVQKQIRDRQPWIARTPGVANGGRLLHFVEPEAVGWDRVRELANEDRLAGFPAVRGAETIAAIHQHLGPHWKTPAWDVFLGAAERVVPHCRDLIASIGLPAGWRIEPYERPTDDQIRAVQALNVETGVSPYPAYYSRGDAVPTVTLCILDARGELVATAGAAFRYHAECRLAGTLFAGMVSVSPSHRGKGLGKLVNAVMMVESHTLFAWTTVKEQVATDNVPSRAMIRACGLDNSEGLVSVAAINSDEAFTR